MSEMMDQQAFTTGAREKRDYALVEHEKPFRYDENGLHVTRGSA